MKKTIENYLLNLGVGLKVWEKGDKRRIYINNLEDVGLAEVESNPKQFRKYSMWFNCETGNFNYNVSRSVESVMEAVIELIKERATEEVKEEAMEEIEVKETVEEVAEETKTMMSPFSRNTGEEFTEKGKTYKVVKCINDPDYDDLFTLVVRLIKEVKIEKKEVKEEDTRAELEKNIAIRELVDEIIKNDATENEDYLMQGEFVCKVGDYPSPNHLTIKKDSDYMYIVKVEKEISKKYKAPTSYLEQIEKILK